MDTIRQMLQQVETQILFCIIAFCAISWHNVPTGTKTHVSFAEFVAVFAVWGLVILGILLIAQTHWDSQRNTTGQGQEKTRA